MVRKVCICLKTIQVSQQDCSSLTLAHCIHIECNHFQGPEVMDERDMSGKCVVHWAACQNLGGVIRELKRQGANL
jgi:hypothetical protein